MKKDTQIKNEKNLSEKPWETKFAINMELKKKIESRPDYQTIEVIWQVLKCDHGINDNYIFILYSFQN